MEKEHISTVLLLSVLLTFMCPVLGIIPLYHSIEAWKKNRKSDVSYVISLKKAYSWTKRIFIALLIIWIVAAILFFGGYYFKTKQFVFEITSVQAFIIIYIIGLFYNVILIYRKNKDA